MYGGGNVGYYCDACWESRVTRGRRAVQIAVGAGVALLALNVLGLLLSRGRLPAISGPVWVAGTVVILLVVVGIVALKGRR